MRARRSSVAVSVSATPVRAGLRVCGADETGRAAWAGQLVVAGVRFDYERLDAAPDAIARFAWLKDSEKSPRVGMPAAGVPTTCRDESKAEIEPRLR
jgi:hypothetical protein